MEGNEPLDTIKGLARALLEEVEWLAEAQDPRAEPCDGGEGGAGFYEMVRAYEIRLIRRALLKTRGHQARAARLLRLSPTTLHNKIKLYNLGARGEATTGCSDSCSQSQATP